jgi:hypothetical protein
VFGHGKPINLRVRAEWLAVMMKMKILFGDEHSSLFDLRMSDKGKKGFVTLKIKNLWFIGIRIQLVG